MFDFPQQQLEQEEEQLRQQHQLQQLKNDYPFLHQMILQYPHMKSNGFSADDLNHFFMNFHNIAANSSNFDQVGQEVEAWDFFLIGYLQPFENILESLQYSSYIYTLIKSGGYIAVLVCANPRVVKDIRHKFLPPFCFQPIKPRQSILSHLLIHSNIVQQNSTVHDFPHFGKPIKKQNLNCGDFPQ